MIIGAAGLVSAGQAYAADAAAAASTTAVQEIVVTGSRIPSKNLTSVSPVTTVDNREIKLQGATNVEDFLNNLPEVFSDQGQYESNGSVGTATVQLRNLGPSRTLVLIDGKRVQPGDPNYPFADLNFIPAALIDHVDVLTGGASAVYGSDAVAGVVNFVMKKNLQGLQIDVQTSIYEHENNSGQAQRANVFGNTSFGFPLLNLPKGTVWTGQRHSVTITGGVATPDDKGSVEFYLGYTSIDPVLQGQYDYATCSLATNNTNTLQQYCGGSTTDATGRLKVLSGPNNGQQYDILLPPNGNTLQGFSLSQAYNYAPLNYIQRNDTRYQAGFFAEYKLNEALDFYSNFMYMNDTSVAQIGPSGSFYAQNAYTIPCNDPLLSAAQANSICGANAGVAGTSETVYIGRRNVEGGGRRDELDHTAFRMLIGFKGDIGDGWKYDLSAQWGQTNQTHSTANYFLNSHLLQALDVIPGPNGTAVCASGGNCVPYNLWTPGGVTPAALNYLNGTAQADGETTQQVVTFNISNNLERYGIKSPYADEGVGVSVGAEYHREFLTTSYDAAFQSGDLAGNNGSSKDTQGSQVDKDIFAELRAPIAQDKPFIKDLTLEAGYRFSNYSHGGDTNAFKVGGDWQVIPDFKIRASFERAVRAPNVQDLYNPQAGNLFGGSDPCAGSHPGLTAAQCYNTMTASHPEISYATFASTIYGHISPCISAQCGDYLGGNPNLTPETADTVSVGFVFTPTFFRPFTLSLDYFDITVNKAIITLAPETIITNCAVLGNPFDCAQIVRDGLGGYTIYGGNGNGLLASNAVTEGVNSGYVNSPLVNGSSLKTSGFDIKAAYRVTLPSWGNQELGNVAFNFDGTYVSDLRTTIPDGTSYNCAGLYGVTCGTPTPKWRHQFRITWNTPWKLQASVNWRYIAPVGLDFNTSQPDLQDGGYKDLLPTDAHIGAYSYFDLAFTYKVKDRYTFRAGIDNIFDRTPPLLDANSFGISSPPNGNGNTYPQVYDPLGRKLFIGVTADF